MLFVVKMTRKSDANENHTISSLNIKISLPFQMNCITRLFNTYLTHEINACNLMLAICLHSMKMTTNNITQHLADQRATLPEVRLRMTDKVGNLC